MPQHNAGAEQQSGVIRTVAPGMFRELREGRKEVYILRL